MHFLIIQFLFQIQMLSAASRLGSIALKHGSQRSIRSDITLKLSYRHCGYRCSTTRSLVSCESYTLPAITSDDNMIEEAETYDSGCGGEGARGKHISFAGRWIS